MTITIHAPAKLNLSLAVIERRDDGYHDIESLMVPVTLHDTLHVTPTQTEGITLTVQLQGRIARLDPVFAGDVPIGKENLVVRAAEALAREAGIKSSRKTLPEPPETLEAAERVTQEAMAAVMRGDKCPDRADRKKEFEDAERRYGAGTRAAIGANLAMTSNTAIKNTAKRK